MKTFRRILGLILVLITWRVQLLGSKLDGINRDRIELLKNQACSIVKPFDSRNIAAQPYRILISANTGFLPVLLNWLIYYFRLCSNESVLYILCLDDQIERKLIDYGLKCSHIHHLPVGRQAYSRLLLIRTRLTYDLLFNQTDVLLSDLDALWIRDPFPYLHQQYESSQIISSRAKFPEDIAERLGATLCMGFIYIKSMNSTIALWKYFSESVAKAKYSDDQRAINDILIKNDIQYPNRLKFYKNTMMDTGVLKFQKKWMMNITLLPQHLFRRHCDLNHPAVVRESVVAHCNTMQKNDNIKKVAFSLYGLWNLSDVWKESTIVGQNRSVANFIRSLAIR